jgi:pimeloyl-ACP methyl ester carboxylesterase
VRAVRVALLAALGGTLVCAAPAAAVDRYLPMRVPHAPGPAKYDKVWVQQLGPRSARRVLVLVPGTLGGAGGVAPVARDIVRRVPGMQLWIVDRREQVFEDVSVFRHRDPDAALDYYLGFKYHRVLGEDARFVADWGLKTQLRDLRAVVKRAKAGGRRVILGGHSAGASTAVAYAAWDFGGRPGYRDLSGLVLIDGGLLGSFSSANLTRARRELADIRSGKVFLDLLGFGLPEIAGIFSQVGALYAYERPNDPAALQDFALLPDVFKPALRVTNEAQFGYAFDDTTSPG